MDDKSQARLDKIVTANTDQAFLCSLANWLFKLSGNVNAAQRLNVIALRVNPRKRGGVRDGR